MSLILDPYTPPGALEVPYLPDALRTVDPAGRPDNLIQVDTTRFGLLEAHPDLILELPDGLIGFERWKQYIVVRTDDDSLFRWLQSADNPSLAFPVVDPCQVRLDYAPVLTDIDARGLLLTAESPTLLFAVVTVPAGKPREMTMNLLAPLVFNPTTRTGRQVIVQNEGYTTRHRITEELQRSTLLQKSA